MASVNSYLSNGVTNGFVQFLEFRRLYGVAIPHALAIRVVQTEPQLHKLPDYVFEALTQTEYQEALRSRVACMQLPLLWTDREREFVDRYLGTVEAKPPVGRWHITEIRRSPGEDIARGTVMVGDQCLSSTCMMEHLIQGPHEEIVVNRRFMRKGVSDYFAWSRGVGYILNGTRVIAKGWSRIVTGKH